MKENKILVLGFEPSCAAFECTETWKTQKTITGLSVQMWKVIVRMLGLATVRVQTPKKQENPAFER